MLQYDARQELPIIVITSVTRTSESSHPIAQDRFLPAPWGQMIPAGH